MSSVAAIQPYPRLAAVAAAVLVASAAPPACAAVNLIVNGGFETPATPTGSFTTYGGGANLGGWTVTGTNRSAAVQTLSNTYAEGPLTFNSFAGQAALDLSGQNNAGPTSGVFQTVETVVGQRYDLSFWVGNAAGGAGGNYKLPSTVNLQINDAPVSPFTNSDVTLNGVNWRLFTTTFWAASDHTSIGFFNGTPLGDAYTGLDNVRLVAGIPEPQSWALMILGFGGVGAMLRSRRWSRGAAAV